MTKEQFEKIMVTAKSGVPFTAYTHQRDTKHNLVGKLEIDVERNRFWMCYDEGESGNEAPNKHGYKKSWEIKPNNLDDIISISLEVVVNNYEIY